MKDTKYATVGQLKKMAINIKEITKRDSSLTISAPSWDIENYQIYIASLESEKGGYVIKNFPSWKKCQEGYLKIIESWPHNG